MRWQYERGNATVRVRMSMSVENDFIRKAATTTTRYSKPLVSVFSTQNHGFPRVKMEVRVRVSE